jgi:hypothetical protein
MWIASFPSLVSPRTRGIGQPANAGKVSRFPSGVMLKGSTTAACPRPEPRRTRKAARDFIMVEPVSKTDFMANDQYPQAEVRKAFTELRNAITEVRHALEVQTLQLTIRFGLMLAVWIWISAIILKCP